MKNTMKLFICYAHEDEKHTNTLLNHLSGLSLQGLIDAWSDKRIKAGSDWLEEIENAISKCHAALLLVSADFMASAFIQKKEIPALFKRKQKDGIRIVPIILRACNWDALEYGKLQALPKHAKPISKYRSADEAWAEIVKQIREWCEKDLQLRTIGQEPKSDTFQKIAPTSWPFQATDGLYLPNNYPDIGFYEIDRVVFSEEYTAMSERDLGSPNNSIEWFQRNAHIYTMLMLDGEVIGYCNVMPLEDTAFQLILDGMLSDGEIPASMVRSFELPGPYKMYICSVAILPKYRRNHAAFRTLYKAFFDKLLALARDGIYITDFAANALTDDGTSLCQSFGMKFLRRNVSQGDVYHLNLLAHGKDSRMPTLRNLLNKYAELGLVYGRSMTSKQ